MTQPDQTTSGRTPNPGLRAAHDARLFVAPYNRRIGQWRTQIARLNLWSLRATASRPDAGDLGATARTLVCDAGRLRSAFELRLCQLDPRARANSRIEDTRRAIDSIEEQAGLLAVRFTRTDG